jgi:toxin ParE1/3/4
VVFSPEANEDLLGLYDYIAGRSGGVQALRYIERIEGWCESLSRFPDAVFVAMIFGPVSG